MRGGRPSDARCARSASGGLAEPSFASEAVAEECGLTSRGAFWPLLSSMRRRELGVSKIKAKHGKTNIVQALNF